jgi:mono/diheme cytochrome c family protein
MDCCGPVNKAVQTRTILILISAFIFLWGCQQPAPEQAEVATEPQVEGTTHHTLTGREAYREYCMNCHGESARGNGPLAELLKVPPPDLTRLTIRNNGEFPSNTVYSTIDGREDFQAHGSREMPIWGSIWSDVDMDEAEVNEQVIALVQYLMSLQVTE